MKLTPRQRADAVGHFLTAVAFGFWMRDPFAAVFAWAMLTTLSSFIQEARGLR